MFNIDIFYSNNTLNVSIEGVINKNNINQIKKDFITSLVNMVSMILLLI